MSLGHPQLPAPSAPSPQLVCGVDEAGRGPLAGPVCAAAVILDPQRPIAGLKDSKRLTAAQRERLAEAIRRHAAAWSVAWASVAEIDRLNVLQATLLAMQRAVAGLPLRPAIVLVDGDRCPPLDVPARAVVRGDGLEPCISAASILAKTERDKEMRRLADIHPQYGFERHAGYPTPEHLQALRRYGPCAAHRTSFAPVRACIQKDLLHD
ncbi:MAG: ribonuclease HII [Thiobacillaceae bacterium]|nr:ribonuclease HII [Thiobacillaceae bacterium]